MKKINAIIQAKVNSKRLPNKVILPILNQPLIFYIYERLKQIKEIDHVVIATSSKRINQKLLNYAKKLKFEIVCFENESDICGRLCLAIKKYKSDAIIKINADCPIPEINIIRRIIRLYVKNDYDYISNKKNFTWPPGFSVELIKTNVLQWCNVNLTNSNDREFVANWISEHVELFKSYFIKKTPPIKYHHHLMVDTKDDFDVINKIYEFFYKKKKFFNENDILKYFKKNYNS